MQIPDKRALVGEIYRMLKPGGRLLAGDWCRIDEPYSALMERFFDLECLTYNMESRDTYRTLLGGLGFTYVKLTDITDQYRVQAHDEYVRIKGR